MFEAKRAETVNLLECALSGVSWNQQSGYVACLQNTPATLLAMNPGSYDAKKRFCRSVMDTHIPPTAVHWVPLDPESLAHIQSIPFWSDVVRSQAQMTAAVSAFAQTLTDPLLKEAIALQAQEQQHLMQTLQSFIAAYGLAVAPVVPVSLKGSPETAFRAAAYQRGIDVFLGCGLLEAMRKTRFVPGDFLQPFESIVTEQVRHAVFFANWVAYCKATQNQRWPEGRIIPVLWRRSGALLTFLAGFKQKDIDERAIATQWMSRFTGDGFLNLCIATYQQKLQTFDPELLRPEFSQSWAILIRDLLKVWPQRKASPTIDVLN